ncbi:MAG: hypothetical protein AAF098_19985, partial [Pseudomonadota bacterium]
QNGDYVQRGAPLVYLRDVQAREQLRGDEAALAIAEADVRSHNKAKSRALVGSPLRRPYKGLRKNRTTLQRSCCLIACCSFTFWNQSPNKENRDGLLRSVPERVERTL